MGKYLLLIHGREARDLSPGLLGEHLAKWNLWIESLRSEKRFDQGGALAESGHAVKDRLITDGPFAETKDAVSGYLIIGAPGLDEAAALAKSCPVFDVGGWVEVREIANT